MEKVFKALNELIAYAKKNLELDEKNADYVLNGVLPVLGLDTFVPMDVTCGDERPEAPLCRLLDACVEAGLFAEEQRGYVADQVMGALSLLPQEVDDKFHALVSSEGSEAATEWFYDYSVKNDYVKKEQLDKNPRFDSEGLVITINKAKPEFRDPKKAVSGNSVKGGYPKCTICHENEGFAGRNKRTLRTVDLIVGGQKWFWQFSPYGYFYQHGIAVNYNHIPMHVDKGTFTRLMDFVDAFPHYFIGSNAPLERIGGSVLAHDHYQGGGEILPMHKAKAAFLLKNPKYPDAIVEVVDWAGTVVRIVSKNRAAIEEIGDAIRQKWDNYEDKAKGIIPRDEKGQHNAVSPTVVKTQRGYEMSVILRSNVTSEEFPDGVFHAHPEFHIIKKESIGLIEAQGLFILPGRLERELGEIEALLSAGKPLTEELSDFAFIYEEIKALCNGDFSKENVSAAVKKELGSVCNRILDNTAVFKDKADTVRFMNDLGFEKC